MIKELISVIVPIYNAEKYLNKCIDSICNQSYKKFEIILIDDGSIDSSSLICNKYVNKNKNIKVIHKKNDGPAAARNDGIKISEGEFVFFIDADDYIENNAFELLINAYQKNKADIIVGNFKKIKDGREEIRSDILIEKNKIFNAQDIVEYARLYLKKPNKNLLFAFSWARLFRLSIFKKYNIFFDERLHTFEDVSLNFKYLKYTKKIIFIDDIIYNHLVYNNLSSATTAIGDNPKKLFGYKLALKNIAIFLKGKISNDEIKKEIGQAFISLTIIQLVRICGQIDGNKEYVLKFIQELINDSYLRDNIKYYHPSKGESRFIPICIKLKLARLIIWNCKYKAYKRYKNK